MKTFKEAYNLLVKEDAQTDPRPYDESTPDKLEMASKIFDGSYQKIKVILFDMLIFGNWRVTIYSLKDPKIAGYVEYDSKKAAVIAYNEMATVDDLIHYMKNYRNEYTAFWWELLLRDEDTKRSEEEAGAPPSEGMPEFSTEEPESNIFEPVAPGGEEFGGPEETPPAAPGEIGPAGGPEISAPEVAPGI